jgi:hypothetical protein
MGLALVGKVTISWFGENGPYARSRYLFGPQTCTSSFYVPQNPTPPFDVIIGSDLINEYRLDQCKCLGGYSSGERTNDSFTLLDQKKEKLRRMSKDERESNSQIRTEHLSHQKLLKEEEEKKMDRARKEQRLKSESSG